MNKTLALQLNNFLVEAYEKASPIHKHKAGNSVPYYTVEDKNKGPLSAVNSTNAKTQVYGIAATMLYKFTTKTLELGKELDGRTSAAQ